jgi:hypothetical protein
VIRHIVSWKLIAEDEAAKALAAAEITEALEALPAHIPEVLALSVSRNIAYPEKNFDVILVADFKTLDGLDVYQVHPEHIKAAGVVGARVNARACVDFEVEG